MRGVNFLIARKLLLKGRSRNEVGGGEANFGQHLSLASQSVCVWKGSSGEMRHTYMKSAQEGGTLICHTKPVESGRAVWRREKALTFSTAHSSTHHPPPLEPPRLVHAQHF